MVVILASTSNQTSATRQVKITKLTCLNKDHSPVTAPTNDDLRYYCHRI